MKEARTDLEILSWHEQGYRPLLFSRTWMVAILNWEPPSAPENLKDVERHVESDEAFVLLDGRAMLVTGRDGTRLAFEDLAPRTIYNVPRGVWHAVVATRDARLLIVEDRDTHLRDTETRPMTGEELRAVEHERCRVEGYGEAG